MLDDLEPYHRCKNHKPSTRSLVRGALNHWRRLGFTRPTDDALACYRDARLAEGAAPDTVRGELTKLIGVAKWLGYDPVVKKPSNVERCPEAWNRSQLRRLFREARTTKRIIWGIPGNVYWPALLGVAYDTGERIGALLSVRAGDFTGRLLRCPAEVRKGGYRDAAYQLSRNTLRDMRRLWVLHPTGPVFLHGSPSRLWQAYTALLTDAGLPADRRSKFHRLRRTHATFVHLAGGDATAAMGHRDSATTWRYYIDATMIPRRLPWRPWPWW